jgi:hypothetical protein
MEKEEYITERFDDEKVEDISADYDLQEEDDSPIEEVRVTIPSTSPLFLLFVILCTNITKTK